MYPTALRVGASLRQKIVQLGRVARRQARDDTPHSSGSSFLPSGRFTVFHTRHSCVSYHGNHIHAATTSLKVLGANSATRMMKIADRSKAVLNRASGHPLRECSNRRYAVMIFTLSPIEMHGTVIMMTGGGPVAISQYPAQIVTVALTPSTGHAKGRQDGRTGTAGATALPRPVVGADAKGEGKDSLTVPHTLRTPSPLRRRSSS